ncbi:unnamed protein product [Mesocestoides corti]|uniref:DUF222 domain-containing protein n=1 Tax=Mesocestoides corti TaxID=53468 RepID=A0A0R3U892_MESCO|nr:unnamed protein product [Mesocestoides corti]
MDFEAVVFTESAIVGMAEGGWVVDLTEEGERVEHGHCLLCAEGRVEPEQLATVKLLIRQMADEACVRPHSPCPPPPPATIPSAFTPVEAVRST